MATAYTPILQLALPVTGELQGTWGTVVNDNITSMIEQAIAGLATINTWTTASHTLTTANGTTDEARCAVLECSGAPGAAATVICPTSTKLYVIKNSVTGGYAVTLKTSAGTGISVPNGSTALLYCDGTNVVSGATYMATVSTTQVDILAQGDLRLQDTTGGEYVALQAPATLAASYTLTMPVDDGTAGQALVTDGSGVLSWSTAASGDVYGPASATDNAVARFDLTTGKIIQNSVVTIADTTGNMAGVGTLSSGAITSSSLTSGRVPYAGTAGLIQDAAALTFDGTILSATRFAGALNGTVGATTPSTGAFTTMSGTGQLTLTNASNYNLYASGAGDNYFAGSVGIGTITMSQVFNVTGVNGSGFTGQRIQNYTGGSGIAGVEFSSDPTYAKAAIGLLREQLNGGGTLSLYNSSSTSAANWATTDARLQIGFTGAVSLAAPAGSESLRVTPVASSVNYWDFYGSVTGSDPYLFPSGSDTNRGFKYLTKGTGSHQFQTGSSLTNTQFVVAHAASAVNYIQVQGAPGAVPFFSSQGSSTDIDMGFVAKGAGFHTFYTGGTSYLAQFQVKNTASAVNYLQVTGGDGTTTSPRLQAAGSSANITFQYLTKGTGEHNFYTNGAHQFNIANTTSAVNYLQVTGAVTTGTPVISAQGSDTNISLRYQPKGTGSSLFLGGDGTAQFLVSSTVTAVNFFQVYGSPTGSSPALNAIGADTNIDLALTPKGTGVLAFGTYTAGIIAQAGYITIKDAGGTSRRLLVG